MSICTDWKGAVHLGLSLAVFGLAACGGAGGPPVSHLSKRAFVSDDFDSSLHIEDAARDVESGFTIATGSRPGTMVLSPDKSITLVFDAGNVQLAVVSNSSESVLGRIVLPNVSTGYVSMSDNTVGFVAVPNCPQASCSENFNVVEVVDLKTTFNITGTVPIAQVATTLVLSPTENKLLVFGGLGDHQDTLTVIDTATAKTTPATAATQIGTANCPLAAPNCFDRPVSAVLSNDGSKAFIFNCGAECGGSVASVTVLDLTTTPPTPGASIPVMAATTGLLNGSTLYVAGSPLGFGCAGASPATTATSCGTLQIIDTGTLTAGAPIIITDGSHDHMELGSNNQLFIGARSCTNVSTTAETRGCLTIFDTAASKVVVPPVNFDVTGIAPISNRTIVYVVQGGELKIYNTSTSPPALTPTQIDVVGKAVDVKYVDQ
jgi:hypothetical protein